MNIKFQPLMRSQFILTYGPGSIIESENGPRLIPALNLGIYKFSKKVKNYEIFDVRMEQLISKTSGKEENIHLFTLPSNVAEDQSENSGLYKTLIFPAWKICYNQQEHKSKTAILYNSADTTNCPVCGKESSSHTRFVCACPDGHLDDVNWNYAVHSSAGCGYNNYFEWDAKGNSLSSITIKCPKCHEKISMDDIYRKPFKCTSRLPEEEPLRHNKKSKINVVNYGYSEKDKRETCDEDMKIIQRQSASLRVPLTRTLLTLPQYDTPTIKIIQKQNVNSRKIIDKMYTEIYIEKKPFNEVFDLYGSFLDDDVAECIIEDHDFIKEAKLLYSHEGEYSNLLNEEFKVLSDISQDNSENFEKGKPVSFNIQIIDKEFTFKVFPINKIRTITAQLGYQRYIRTSSKELNNDQFKIRYIGVKPLSGQHEVWFPAFEGIGEGLFITSDLDPLEIFDLKKNREEWENVNSSLFSDISADIYKPLLVWWHTLSHAIIRELGYTSGYSSSSIRERVYATKKGGGILLYNTSAGDDCGMGGLVESTKRFDKIIENALLNLENCSNDPLCDDIRINKKSINGAACINCLLLSETSCEFGNRLLDRHMLLGN